jgi:hypothetical protein
MFGLDALVALDLGQRLVKDQFRAGDSQRERRPGEAEASARQARASSSLVRSLRRTTPRRARLITGSTSC